MAAEQNRKRTSRRRTPVLISAADSASLATLSDDDVLETVQRQTFNFFWEGAHPQSGFALDRCTARRDRTNHKTAVGGSGFGIMAIVVAVERSWVTREAALDRLGGIIDVLIAATVYHGAFPHYLHGRTGTTIPFSRKDDGGDLVETSFLCMGLLCARQYFRRDTQVEKTLRARITWLWEEVEWDWYTRGGSEALYWHWSPNNDWALNHKIRGWNECLITYVLAAAAPRYPIDPVVYHQGFASGPAFLNGHSYYGIELPLGPPFGGPLFFTHYSFCGLDPHGLKDRYADYWEQNLRHVAINRAHCIANPGNYLGYGESCWGLTASDDPDGYVAHAPDLDNGTITPTASLASLPYAPREVMSTLRHFLSRHGPKIWGPYGFFDAFCEQRNWFSDVYLAIDQGPIVVMMENHRTGLLWKLFMGVPEVQAGLRKLGFSSPYLAGRTTADVSD
jgi:hypothetical protein